MPMTDATDPPDADASPAGVAAGGERVVPPPSETHASFCSMRGLVSA